MTDTQPKARSGVTDSAEMPTVQNRGNGRWAYTCSLCSREFGPFVSEQAAREWADLHTSECRDA